MLDWVARLLLILSGAATGVFVADDAPSFGIIQTMVAITLVTLIVFVLAFWPRHWSFKRSKTDGGR